MENAAGGRDPNPNAGGDGEAPPTYRRGVRREMVVVMGPTGSGKSRLAVDLASSFPIEIVNADSMQFYRGLNILTNKAPVHQRNGVPHHLLATVSPDVQFTAKAFCDASMPLNEEIWSRDNLPVVVGGTNYYLQALLCPFLWDDFAADTHDEFLYERTVEENQDVKSENNEDSEINRCDRLRDIDPVAANRIHPNNQRKISQHLDLYDRFQVIPSEHFQSQKVENWGRVDSLKYDCCFICVDALLPALDEYDEKMNTVPVPEAARTPETKLLERNLWTLYACQVCGDRVLRGAHELEQHKHGHSHSKRTSKLRKSGYRGFGQMQK